MVVRQSNCYCPPRDEAIAIDGEVGENDFRISDMGGDMTYDAFKPAVAYNSTNHEFLVVWEGDDGTLTTNGEFEIFGARLNAATGAEIEGEFRISHVGADGNPSRAAHNPAVAYNSTDNQYLVAWEGDEPVQGAFEIYGRRIEGDTGDVIGPGFRISDMGANDTHASFDAYAPAIAYNDQVNRYLVVWHGDDDAGPLVDDEFEIYGQVIDASNGGELGTDFRISSMDGLATFTLTATTRPWPLTAPTTNTWWSGAAVIPNALSSALSERSMAKDWTPAI